MSSTLVMRVLLATCLTMSAVLERAEAKAIKWRFTLIEGNNGDAGFDVHKTLCVPYFGGFITRMPASSDPQFADVSLAENENILPESLTVSDVAPSQSQTCDFHAEKQSPTSGKPERCVVFYIRKGPAGAQVCEGQWELRVVTDK